MTGPGEDARAGRRQDQRPHPGPASSGSDPRSSRRRFPTAARRSPDGGDLDLALVVADALDSLPLELGELMDNVAVVVEDAHPTEDLLGLYEGVPLTERGDYGGLAMPDRVTVYRLAVCANCGDEGEVRREVAVTVVHEIAHHFGIDDDTLADLGWD